MGKANGKANRKGRRDRSSDSPRACRKYGSYRRNGSWLSSAISEAGKELLKDTVVSQGGAAIEYLRESFAKNNNGASMMVQGVPVSTPLPVGSTPMLPRGVFQPGQVQPLQHMGQWFPQPSLSLAQTSPLQPSPQVHEMPSPQQQQQPLQSFPQPVHQGQPVALSPHGSHHSTEYGTPTTMFSPSAMSPPRPMALGGTFEAMAQHHNQNLGHGQASPPPAVK